MRRRALLAAVGAAGASSLAGCSAMLEELGDSPALEVRELIQSNAQLICSEQPRDRVHTITIQNIEDAGNIGVALFWQTQRNVEKPESVKSGPTLFGWEREQLQEIYFEANERRTVEFTATPPDNLIRPLFFAESLMYGARIHNSGAGGQVSVTLQYENQQASDGASGLPMERSVFIGADSTEEVRFNTTIPENRRWEIEARPDQS